MTACAIYARKSTEQVGVAEANKSVTRQNQLARAFAAAKGWTVVAEFEDDGFSGAEFERRPGFQLLMQALKPRPPFEILIVAEQKALGRESYETQHTIKRLAQAGVEIWAYMDQRSLTPRNWLDKAMASVRSWADEAHREDTARRTHEAHLQKMKRGYVVGGRVYGYRNEHVYSGTDAHGNPMRQGARRVIDPAEAEVVLRIFEWYASGLGLKAIAKRLTLEHAPKPTAPARADGLTAPGWAPSTVRTVLVRPLYRGEVVWNRSRKRDDWGQVRQRNRPAGEWARTVDESLRINPEHLWIRVASRRADTEGRAVRFESGRLSGRPPKHGVQNLLAGLATCGVCGGGLVVETSQRRVGRVSAYVCHRHRYGGCPNGLGAGVEETNEAVLEAIEEHALTPEAVEQVVALTERDDLREREAALQQEQRELARLVARLVAVLESGGDVPSVVAKLRELEARQTAVVEELESLRPLPRLPAAVIESRLGEWRRLLRQSVTQARAVLQAVLQGRITFTPVEGGYDLTAPTRFNKLFEGIVAAKPVRPGRPRNLNEPLLIIEPGDLSGTEDIPIEETPFFDYGLLLERAYRAKVHKGGTSPAGFEPAF